MDVAGLQYICASAGFIMIVGSLILIAKRIIYIDSQTGEVTSIKLPLGFKIKTNLPVIMMLLLGVFMLAFPIATARNGITMRYITTPVFSKTPVRVYAVIDEDEIDGNRDQARLGFPELPDTDFRIVYVTSDGKVVREKLDPSGKQGPVGIKNTADPVTPLVADIKTVTTVSPTDLARFKSESGD